MKRLFAALVLLLIILPTMAGLVGAQDDATIAEIFEGLAEADDAEFTVLLQLLEVTDLVDTLDDEGAEFTVFAPTDEAFEDLLDEMGLEIDDLTGNGDLLAQVLLYHVVDGIFEADDLEDVQELETLQGGIIVVMIDDDSIVLNDIAELVTADLEASNGIIHVIDAVLLPQIEVSSGEACLVSTSVFNGTSVHVGPGNNRTSVTFLEVDVEYSVLGQNEDSEGVIWYQLDKDEAAPGRAINEAWVSSEEVETTGDCENVGEASAPPIIPIISQPAQPATDPNTDNTETDTSEQTTDTGVRPQSGRYTIVLAEFTNASCAGGPNIPIPSTDFWTSTVFTTNVTSTSSSLTLFGNSVLTFSNGRYNGQVLIDGEFYTTTAFPGNANFFTGTIIVSFVSGGRNCSGSVNFSATRQ